MKKTKLGQELISGLKEAIAYERGEINLRTHKVILPDNPPEWSKEDISKLRIEKLRVSQPILAAYLGVSPAAIRAWEQGFKKPSGSARRLLQIINISPDNFLHLIDNTAPRRLKRTS
jgi:DNA-binding transcriptional regulator YiaG